MTPTATKVGIAVVEHNGRYLIGTRDEHSPLAGLSEFPGGKCHANEDPRDCAVRECLEETGLAVIPDSLLLNRLFEYPHGSVDLNFWLCRLKDATAIKEEHRGLRWIEVVELGSLQFPEANAPLIELLTGK